MSEVISWGNQVGNWRCGVVATVAEVDSSWADVTVTCVWQSLGYGFNVAYCSAWVSCDGSGGGANGAFRATSANGSTTSRDVYSKTFRVARGTYDAPVAVAASFVMPDFQPGSSYASATVTVPAKPSVKPDPVTGVDVTASGLRAALTWFNNAKPEELKPYLGIRVQEGRNGSLGTVREFAGDATGAAWDMEPDSRYGFDVWPYNNAGDGDKAWAGFVYTAPAAPTSVLATFTGSAVNVTWGDPSRWGQSFEVWSSGDGGDTWGRLGTTESCSWTDSAPPQGMATYRVRTFAPDGTTASAYGVSDPVPTYSSSDYPKVTFGSMPAAHDVPYVLTWTVSGDSVAAQRIAIVVDHEVVQQVDLDPSARSFDVLGIGLVDGDAVTVRLTVTDSKALSTLATSSFAVDWWPPAVPTVAAEADGLGVFLAVSGSTPTANEVPAAFYEAVRGPYSLLESEGGFYDPVPPVNATSRYTVAAVAGNGLTSEVEAEYRLVSDMGGVTVGGETVPLRLNMTWSESAKLGGSAIHFAGRALPDWYGSGELSNTVTAKAAVDEATLERLRDAMRGQPTVWLRDPMGHVAYGAPQLSWTAKGAGQVEATVKLTETEAPHELG